MFNFNYLLFNGNFRRYSFVLILIFLMNLNISFSQDKIDTRGNEFYIAFIPNFHIITIGNNSSDSLIIFLAAEKPCTVNIKATDRNGNFTNRQIAISTPNTVITTSYPYRNYTLNGFNTRQQINLNSGEHETPVPQHFYITSDENISVYAADYANFSTDAFMVLPTHMLDKEYMVMSYNSDIALDFNGDVQNSSTPSQYAVTAIEDNTTISFKNTTSIAKQKNNVQDIILNKGQSYLVQADPFANAGRADLTGSLIKSDKPIAVFSGHQRATLPFNIPIDNPSRDILIEQLTPTKYWGKNAIVCPLPLPRRQNSFMNDLFRVMALYDNTEIFFNDRLITTLQSGEFYQQYLDSAYYISASSPISVAVFKKTGSTGSQGIDYFGDPYMALLPPVEQFHNVYLSTNVQMTIDFENMFTDHFITVFIENSIAQTLTIDDLTADFTQLNKVGNSNYLYGHFKVSEGFHTVKSSGKVGILISGYGPANSYGYLGGISQYPVDFNQPKVLTKFLCGQIDITATDSLELDEGISGVEVISSDNIELVVPLVTFPTPVYEFSLKLIDKYKSGTINLKVKDASNAWVTKDYKIDPITVQLEKTDDQIDGLLDAVYSVDLQLAEDRKVCYEFKLNNLSNIDFDFTEIKSKFGKVVIDNFSVNKIDKGSSLLVKFCIVSNNIENGIFQDSIFLFSDCLNMLLATVNYEVQKDNSEPTIVTINENCDELDIIIQDINIFDKGIESVQIIEQENCKVDTLIINPRTFQYKVGIIDKSLDMIFRIIITDSLGNTKEYEKIIQGFTLSTSGGTKEFKPDTVNIPVAFFDDYSCVPIKLYNYGIRDFVINDLKLKFGVDYYIPKSQLPFTIPVGSSNDLIVCFATTEFKEEYFDSLKFTHNCIDYYIELETEKFEDLNITDKCGGELIIYTSEGPISVGGFYPNPSSDRTSAIISVPKDTFYNADIYDILGNKVLEIQNSKLLKGDNDLILDLNNFNSGIYYLNININGNKSSSILNVNK